MNFEGLILPLIQMSVLPNQHSTFISSMMHILYYVYLTGYINIKILYTFFCIPVNTNTSKFIHNITTRQTTHPLTHHDHLS